MARHGWREKVSSQPMLLRVLPLLIALTLLGAPNRVSAALVTATPASVPPATSENASTAFLEGGSESRIGLLCHNDPVNKSDPFGLEFNDTPIVPVPFVTIPGAEMYGGVQFALSPNVVTQAVPGGYTARVQGLNVTAQKAQVATRVQVKGEPRPRERTESQIKATTEHEQGHKDVARSFDKDNQQREFSKVYPSADKAKGGAADQLQKDFEKAQKEYHDRIKELMKKESFR